MKALILAAGLGTRLRPHTLSTPKSLFPIFGQPNLDIMIHRLEKANCSAVVVNTHHLHEKIEKFLAAKRYTIPVQTQYEPVILGTGGAIKSLEDFWDDEPFIVINGDVVTDIDPAKIYRFHLNHHHPATLVFCNDPEFNTVSVNRNGFVESFDAARNGINIPDSTDLTFTGVQVLDPLVLDFMPKNEFSGSIEAYKKMMTAGHTIAAYAHDSPYWRDIGTPQRYMEAVFDKMAPIAFHQVFGGRPIHHFNRIQLKGDGSDRTWYRIEAGSFSMVLVDHGIRQTEGVTEFDAFVNIGRHLHQKEIPVPDIFLSDDFSGLVFLKDLGNTHLQDVVKKKTSIEGISDLYESIIDGIIKMSIKGAMNFDPSWTYQSPAYDAALIMEKECLYFVNAFLNGYLNRGIHFEDFKEEFQFLADITVQNSLYGFMHRDMQSRNIMIEHNHFRFIDFQGGRMGPVQYDLASLLIDPYVDLPFPLQQHLLSYAYEKMSAHKSVERSVFFDGYEGCAICRNLQILGAFGFLSRIRGKKWFEQYIPFALKTLKRNLSGIHSNRLSRLKSLVEKLPNL